MKPSSPLSFIMRIRDPRISVGLRREKLRQLLCIFRHTILTFSIFQLQLSLPIAWPAGKTHVNMPYSHPEIP